MVEDPIPDNWLKSKLDKYVAVGDISEEKFQEDELLENLSKIKQQHIQDTNKNTQKFRMYADRAYLVKSLYQSKINCPIKIKQNS